MLAVFGAHAVGCCVCPPVLLYIAYAIAISCYCCSDTNLLVWGVDLVEEHLMCTVGVPARPPVARRPLVQVGDDKGCRAAPGLQRAHARKQARELTSVLGRSLP